MAISDELVPYTEGLIPTGMRLMSFPTNSDEPLASHKLWLEQGFIPAITKHPNARVRVVGMTSRSGSEKSNMGLSQRRADKVANYIRNLGRVNIVDCKGTGEQDAVDDGVPDGNDGARYRAVFLRWEGLTRDVPFVAEPGPKGFTKRTIKTQPGIWLVIGMDTFGLPIKAGVSVGKITITLLNDKGEQWAISGVGVGAGIGAEFGAGQAKTLLAKAVDYLKGLSFKLGDVPNLADGLKEKLPEIPSATTGGIFRQDQIISNWTIDKIVARKNVIVISGGLGVGAVAGELGLLYFDLPLLSSHDEPFGSDTPWGVYSALGALKLSAEIGAMVYGITGHKMIGVLEKEVLDLRN